ncbi:MAG: STAS domain-containing protein [Ignavibacteriales bacterium]|nr:MAG: STAS domain-containing protein [Ignavibacteriales bacterium]
MYDDFSKEYRSDIIIEVVNLTRATIKEAKEFQNILEEDMIKKCRKMVVDLSQCEFIDSTFLGTLVVTGKKMISLGGKIKLVEPAGLALDLLTKTGTVKLMDMFKSKDEAVESFISSTL